MKILVDADACPVREIIVHMAKAHAVPVTLITDTSHCLRAGYAAVVTVEKGRDSVDFRLVSLCCAGDIVVTQDYGVAAMVLGKSAFCIGPNGLVYTNSNIDMMLYARHEAKKARARGRYTAIPKRTAADNAAFEAALRKLMGAALQQEGGK